MSVRLRSLLMFVVALAAFLVFLSLIARPAGAQEQPAPQEDSSAQQAPQEDSSGQPAPQEDSSAQQAPQEDSSGQPAPEDSSAQPAPRGPGSSGHPASEGSSGQLAPEGYSAEPVPGDSDSSTQLGSEDSSLTPTDTSTTPTDTSTTPTDTSTPTETVPVDTTTPTETAPVDTAPVDTAPVDTAPVDTAPTDTVPTDTVPTDTAPTDTVPTDTVPTDTVPTDTTPIDPVPTDTTTPTETAPVDTAPVDTVPTDTVPTDTAPTDTPPVDTAPIEPVGGAHPAIQVDPALDEGSTPEPITDPVGASVAANEQLPGPGDKDPEPVTTTPAKPTPTPVLSDAAPGSGTTAATPLSLEPAASALSPEQPVRETQAPEEMAGAGSALGRAPIPDSGKDQIPSATASATQSGVSKLADRLASSFEELFGIPSKELADNLVRWTAGVAGGVARTVDRVLSALLGGGAGPPASSGGSPLGDSPMAPVPAVPAGGPSGLSIVGGSGTSHSDSKLMLEEFAILILSSIFILQSGKLMRLSGEVLKPGSVSQLAIERPG